MQAHAGYADNDNDTDNDNDNETDTDNDNDNDNEEDCLVVVPKYNCIYWNIRPPVRIGCTKELIKCFVKFRLPYACWQ